MKDEVYRWRKCYKRLGKWTWRLFKGQLIAFGIQAVGLVLALVLGSQQAHTQG